MVKNALCLTISFLSACGAYCSVSKIEKTVLDNIYEERSPFLREQSYAAFHGIYGDEIFLVVVAMQERDLNCFAKYNGQPLSNLDEKGRQRLSEQEVAAFNVIPIKRRKA